LNSGAGQNPHPSRGVKRVVLERSRFERGGAPSKIRVESGRGSPRRLNGEQLLDAFTQYTIGAGYKLDSGATIRRNVSIIHPEAFEIGDRVFFGEQTIIQGRFDGPCVIGEGVWIGPQSYFDARKLVVEDHVGWVPSTQVCRRMCRSSKRTCKSPPSISAPGPISAQTLSFCRE